MEHQVDDKNTIKEEEMVNPNYHRVKANTSKAKSALDKLAGGGSSIAFGPGCVVQ